MLNGEEDHAHLLIHNPATVAISRLVNSLKGISARPLSKENVGRFNRAGMRGRCWSPFYFAGSCGGRPLAVIKDHITNHKRPT